MMLLVGFMYAAIIFDHAHLACPIALGWSNPSFRQHMLKRPEVFVLLPVLCVVISLAIGAGSLTTSDPVFRALAMTYFLWNAWHFASQNWGLCGLAGGSLSQRSAAFALTALCMLAAPILWAHTLWVVIADLGISLIHWITDIKLSAFTAGRYWAFVLAMLIAGGIGFAFKTVESNSYLCGVMAACTTVWSVPVLLGLRYGLGFWHFLMSRWVWSSEGRLLLA